MANNPATTGQIDLGVLKQPVEEIMGIRTYDVTMEFITDALGTRPKNPRVVETWLSLARGDVERAIAKGELPEERLRALETEAHEAVVVAEELIAEGADERELNRWTGFPQDEKTREIFFYDYQIKGCLRELANLYGKQFGVNNARHKVTYWVNVLPRKIYTGVREPDDVLERPLRALTAQGPRVALVRSDVLAAGTRFAFRLQLLPHAEITPQFILKLLRTWEIAGSFQWRNAGYGRAKVVSFAEVDPASPPPGLPSNGVTEHS